MVEIGNDGELKYIQLMGYEKRRSLCSERKAAL